MTAPGPMPSVNTRYAGTPPSGPGQWSAPTRQAVNVEKDAPEQTGANSFDVVENR